MKDCEFIRIFEDKDNKNEILFCDCTMALPQRNLEDYSTDNIECKDNPNCYYKQLQLKDKMVGILIKSINLSSQTGIKPISYDGALQQALAELEA